MIGLALTLALAAPQNPRLYLKEMELPVFVPFNEILVGVEKHPLDMLGIFMSQERFAFDVTGKQPKNWEDARVGNFQFAVRNSVYKGQAGLVVSLESSRNQAVVRNRFEYRVRHKLTRSFYVDDKGVLLGEEFRLDSSSGVYEMQAEFGADSYTITLTSPDRGKRKLGPIFPAVEMKDLRENLFKPMWDGKKQELTKKEKTFYLLDPYTGGVLTYKAMDQAKFSGFHFGKKRLGHTIQITGGPSPYTVYFAQEGEILIGQLEGYGYLLRDQQNIG